ncbi:helix-turn-helix domain-containing protein [Rhodococcus koreensis]
MSNSLLQITDRDRTALARMAVAAQSTRNQAMRAEIVLACTEVSVAEAARRAGVSFRTAMRWKRRFQEDGLAGLDDAQRSGRPRYPQEVMHAILTTSLLEPPAGKWTTRSIAETTGISQTTVSRIRRQTFPPARPGDAPMLADQSALLAFVHIDPHRRILGFYAPAETRGAHRRRRAPSTSVTDPLETVLCAALAGEKGTHRLAPTEATTTLFRRAIDGTPTDRSMTLFLDFTPDTAAERWLSRNPRIDVVVVSHDLWLAQLHPLADNIDTRQLPELLEVQRLIHSWYRQPEGPFTWSRIVPIFGSLTQTVTREEGSLPTQAAVVRGLYESMADGTLHAGGKIAERKLATRVQLPRSAVADALKQLADEGLINQDDSGRSWIPTPTERDVSETYTARAFLGTTLIRRLAASDEPLPHRLDALHDEVVRHATEGTSLITGFIDLDLQDELARAAHMPRTEAMFVRLTLQVRLFVTTMGVNYEYPKDDIVDSGRQLLDAIHAHDVDAAIAAWRSKVDHAAHYMLEQLAGRTLRAERRPTQ